MTDQDDREKKIKQRNRAVAGGLLFLAIMFFVVSVVKVGGNMNVPG